MHCLRFLLCLSLALGFLTRPARTDASPFRRENLVAWCIVPFDAKKRGPDARAAMLKALGIQRLAYDYRTEHIPQWDAEMEALKRHGIELTAWWFPGSLNDEARLILDVIRRHGVHPQLWVTGSGDTPQGDAAVKARIAQEAARLRPVCEAAAALQLKVALYNHGGWFGEPENQIAIIEALRAAGITNAGIVYNQHHGHAHTEDFAALLKRMQPYLLALNLNGMIPNGEARGYKIVPLGHGELDTKLLTILRDSGWQGPIGILNHTDEDAEARLRDNLDGLDWLLKEMDKPGSAAPLPPARSWKAPPPAPKKVAGPDGRERWQVTWGQSPPAGLATEGTAFRELPVTLEIRARMHSAAQFNILAAADPKASPWHWEMYTFTNTGNLCAYLPGRGGNFDTGVALTDGAWHDIAAIIEPQRLRLYVDGQLKKDAVLTPQAGTAVGSGFALGQLVDGGLGCDGVIERALIRRGAHEPATGEWKADAPETLGHWEFHLPPPVTAPPVTGFVCPREPLEPALWPQAVHPVNRHRVYDYYAKQALMFMKSQPRPALIAPWPGLDGGTQGHWGNQNEATWRDGRWNQMDTGPCMAGVIRGGGLTVAKGVCVKAGARSACFDPVTASWPLLWEGGFVKFADFRHGLHDGPAVQGTVLPGDPALKSPQPAAALRYLGYYRHGRQTIFSYRRNGEEMLDALVEENGRTVRLAAPAAGHPLRALTKGGPTQWPQALETTATQGEPLPGWPLAVDTLTLPFDNPWKSLLFSSGHDFLPSGDLALCTMTGDVWTVSGLGPELKTLRWRRIAAGLHQPLGLVVADGKIHVAGRDQVTRLHDLNGDGETDFYECVCNGYTTPAGGHDFICGLERDAEGRLYTASSKEGLLRIHPAGGAEVLASGFRNPDGISLDPASGTLTVSVQEGDWTPASAIAQIHTGAYYGYPGPRPGAPTAPPLLYLPRGIDNSSGGGAWGNAAAWPPLRGNLVHLSYGTGTHHLVLRQPIPGGHQGGAAPLPGDFRAGAHRARFHPADGSLYVSGMTGWGTYTPDDGCLHRVRWLPGPAHIPTAFAAVENGVLLTFSEPVSPTAADPAQHFAQSWNYQYAQTYGSPEYSVRWPGLTGHDVLEITSVHRLDGGRQLFLEIPQILPAHQIHLLLRPQQGVRRELFLTAHHLAPAFTAFPGYQPVAKVPVKKDYVPAPAFTPALNPSTTGPAGRLLKLEAASGLQFATTRLQATPSERLSLTFSNPDALPHNWVLTAPGSLEKVGDLANRMVTEPGAVARHYVPETPLVLAYTDMVPPGGSFTIHFDAPAQPGDYPYLCTFPGHWMIMKGVLTVK